jgi:hypothetical protein
MPGIRYYINPVTGRIIKSTGKTYKELKKRRYILEGDACLYNMTSVKKCLKTINRLYPNVYYPSTFIDIPSTYHKKSNYEAVAFIKNNESVNGYITKNGLLVKLEKPIPVSKTKTLPIVIGENIYEKLEREGMEATSEQNVLLKTQLEDNPLKSDIKILYNPMQDDYIPVKGDITSEEQDNLLNTINNTLIKNTDDTSSDILSDINSDIGSEVGSENESEINSDISSDISNEINSDISSDIGSDISSDINNDIGSEVGSENESEINSEINSDISSEINNDISSEINSEVGSEINSDIGSDISSNEVGDIGSEDDIIDTIDTDDLIDEPFNGSDFSDDSDYYERAAEDNYERTSEDIVSHLPDTNISESQETLYQDASEEQEIQDEDIFYDSESEKDTKDTENTENNKDTDNKTDNDIDNDKLNYIVLNSHEDIIGWLSKL